MRLTLVSVVVVVLVVTAAGCGGSSKKNAASPATTATSTTSATTAATTSSAGKGYGSASTSAAPTFASTHNCAQLAALGAKVSTALQPTGGNAAATVADEAKLLQAMASAAPSEIRGDFQTFATAFSAYGQAFAKAGLQPGKVPTAAQIIQLGAAAKAFNSAKLTAAEQHLSAWAHKNCSG